MGDVKLIDNSMKVKAELNSTSIQWLYEAANEVQAQAVRNCRTGESYSAQLRGSYGTQVNEQAGEAQIGSPLEQAFWEEFGTGSHADTAKNGGKEGRKDWWIYIPGQESSTGKESRHYATKEEAMEMAAYIQAKYGKTGIVTNGKEPNYTLEKAFISKTPWAEKRLEKLLKERMD